MFVIAGFRSKFGIFVFLTMVATTVHLFARDSIGGGVFMICATLFIFGRVPAAIGAYFGSRSFRER